MKPQQKQYQFINSRTGNVIGYLSVDENLSADEQNRKLVEKKAELAVDNHLRVDLIYWQFPVISS